jgi:hypothetical protein
MSSATETLCGQAFGLYNSPLILCKAIPHDGNLLATLMDHQHCCCNNLAPRIHLRSSHLQATRRGRRGSRNSWIYLSLVHSNYLLFSLCLQHPKVPTDAAQEPYCWMALCFLFYASCSLVMDFCEQTELGDSGCNGCDDHIILVSVNWNALVCLWRLVPQHMERFLNSCFY